MLVSEIIKLISGVIESHVEEDVAVKNAFLDSRLMTKGGLFFAAMGEYTDGNQFAEKAANEGASLVIISDKNIYDRIKGNKVLVEDAVETMLKLGSQRFSDSKAFKIAVTGSFGKTGTKEMLKLVFEEGSTVYATPGNKNNMLGVSLTGTGIDDSKTLIIELGSNSPDEIAPLSEMVNPNIAIVTSVGHAHIGRFTNIESIIKEKMSIATGLKKGGTLIIPTHLKKYAPKGDYNIITFGENGDICIKEVVHNGLYIDCKVSGSDEKFTVNHPYVHVAEGILPVICAGQITGIDYKVISNAIKKYKPIKGHGSISVAGDLMIIDDTYNAGFEAILKAAESLDKINIMPKYAVFGEMGEIDGYEETFYKAISDLSLKFPNITFYLCGISYKDIPSRENCLIFAERSTALEAVKSIKNGVVVVKASQRMEFTEFVNTIKTNVEGGNAL